MNQIPETARPAIHTRVDLVGPRRAVLASLIGVFLAAATPVFAASDLAVETRPAVGRSADGAPQVIARITWRNAWRNARNHDAVWLFVKLRSGAGAPWRHARIARVTTANGMPALACHATADRIGAFCAAAATHRGDAGADLTIDIDPAGLGALANSRGIEAQVHGIEMVYVAAGPFSIGDKDSTTASRAAYYRSDANGNHAGVLRIESEAAITVAPAAGALYYRTSTPQYQGDRLGPIPAGFPKGTRAFYAMKYEITQGEYASFLNAIGYEAASFRANIASPRYAEDRGTIRIVDGRYVAASPSRPANMLSWDDGTAFADWAGLRPMTEFEFTKAARGPMDPVANDYPWGTDSKARLLRRLRADGDLERGGDAAESRLTDETREVLGASYWWVMDLAGSVWEKVVSAGHPTGRAFRGTHGDGALRLYGLASNADWPSGDHEAGGYGYRGGGHYEWSREATRDPNARDLNPHSPVSWRPYGAWGGAPRSVAYGFRAVRTAEP
jgi:formylglycine-generating enzyme required for sulfatase activity